MRGGSSAKGGGDLPLVTVVVPVTTVVKEVIVVVNGAAVVEIVSSVVPAAALELTTSSVTVWEGKSKGEPRYLPPHFQLTCRGHASRGGSDRGILACDADRRGCSNYPPRHSSRYQRRACTSSPGYRGVLSKEGEFSG